jgi:hypothetical protein
MNVPGYLKKPDAALHKPLPRVRLAEPLEAFEDVI